MTVKMMITQVQPHTCLMISENLQVGDVADHYLAGSGSVGDGVRDEDVAGKGVAGEDVASKVVTSEDVAGKVVTGENVAGKGVTGEDIVGRGVTGEDVAGDHVEIEKLCGSGVSESVVEEGVTRNTLCAESGDECGADEDLENSMQESSRGQSSVGYEKLFVSPSSPNSQLSVTAPETPACRTVTSPSADSPLVVAGLVPSHLADKFCTPHREDENGPKRRHLTMRVLTENEYYDMLKEKKQKEKEEQEAKERRKNEREKHKKETEEIKKKREEEKRKKKEERERKKKEIEEEKQRKKEEREKRKKKRKRNKRKRMAKGK